MFSAHFDYVTAEGNASSHLDARSSLCRRYRSLHSDQKEKPSLDGFSFYLKVKTCDFVPCPEPLFAPNTSFFENMSLMAIDGVFFLCYYKDVV